MFPIAVGCFSILCAWKWGDWKNWLHYLPTIQYFFIGDLLYNLFTWNHRLWSYPNPPNLLPNHLTNSLLYMLILYPSTMLIYLYRFPKNNFFKQLLYIFIWLVMWLLFEIILVWKGFCVYNHGWTFGWSAIFVCFMLPMLYLHHKRPLWAYLLSVPIILFLLFWLQVPVISKK